MKCTCCGQTAKLYQDNKCRQCLAKIFEGLRPLLNEVPR